MPNFNLLLFQFFFMTTILAIESSCDETSASVCRDGKILSNIIANQTVHEKYGGVVPELASRAHIQNIVPVVDTALSTANCQLSSVEAIAVSNGPGSYTGLRVGLSTAKGISYALNKPLILINTHVGQSCKMSESIFLTASSNLASSVDDWQAGGRNICCSR